MGEQRADCIRSTRLAHQVGRNSRRHRRQPSQLQVSLVRENRGPHTADGTCDDRINVKGLTEPLAFMRNRGENEAGGGGAGGRGDESSGEESQGGEQDQDDESEDEDEDSEDSEEVDEDSEEEDEDSSEEGSRK